MRHIFDLQMKEIEDDIMKVTEKIDNFRKEHIMNQYLRRHQETEPEVPTEWLEEVCFFFLQYTTKYVGPLRNGSILLLLQVYCTTPIDPKYTNFL